MKGNTTGFLVFVVILVVIAGAVGIFLLNKNMFSNDNAQKDKNGRYLTIINDTKQVINEVHVTVGEGTEIEHMRRENPDEESFSIDIPKEYEEYDTFKVILVDRYGTRYEREVTDVNKKGRTEVKISAENHDEKSEGFFDKVHRFFNGD